MGEVDKRLLAKATQQPRIAARLELVPSHVRHAGVCRKAAHGALEECQSTRFGRFFAAFEQGLQAETDAQERHARADAFDQRVAHLHLVERSHHLAEVAYAGQNDLRGIAQSGRIAHDRSIARRFRLSVFSTERRLPAP